MAFKHGDPYGTHRVISPKGVLPQPADVIDNTMEIYDNEFLIDVKTLNLSLIHIWPYFRSEQHIFMADVGFFIRRKKFSHHPVGQGAVSKIYNMAGLHRV